MAGKTTAYATDQRYVTFLGILYEFLSFWSPGAFICVEYTVMQYYQCSNYSQQKTKDLLDLHYAYRNEAPEFFGAPGYEPPKYAYNIWDVA